MATEHRPGTPAIDYRPDQLVVALEHRDAVLRTVGDMGLDSTAGDASADLGLGLVVFAEGAVRRWQELQQADLTTVDGSPVSPVDSLLLALRRRFGEEHAGWVPTLGKNRFVRRVEGEHVIGGGIPPSGGEGDPELLYTGSVAGVGGGEGDPELLYTAAAPYLVAGGGAGEPGSAAEAGWALVPRGSGPGAGVRVGLADTLLFPNGWLAGACLGAADTIWTRNGTDRPPPVEAHAAFVAGVILRRAPAATLQVRAVLGREGNQDGWEVAKQIVRLGRSGIHVMNLSLGSQTEDGRPPLVLAAAIDRIDPGVVVVAAAGNLRPPFQDRSLPVSPFYPAALDDVVAVGAADDDGHPARFSPHGPWVDLLAPGVRTVSLYFNGVARWSGTSFAAAWLSGELAARIRPGRTDAHAALHELVRQADDGDGPPWLP